MMYIINLIIGDWAHEGHGKSSIVTIRSTLSKSEIDNAYLEGSKKLGFSFIEEVGVEFGGCLLTQERLDALDEAGVDTSCVTNYGTEGYYIDDEDSFVELYLSIVNLGDDTFEWERVGHEENHIRIGGYGIFGD